MKTENGVAPQNGNWPEETDYGTLIARSSGDRGRTPLGRRRNGTAAASARRLPPTCRVPFPPRPPRQPTDGPLTPPRRRPRCVKTVHRRPALTRPWRGVKVRLRGPGRKIFETDVVASRPDARRIAKRRYYSMARFFRLIFYHPRQRQPTSQRVVDKIRTEKKKPPGPSSHSASNHR